jgi:uncharacterized protein YycO
VAQIYTPGTYFCVGTPGFAETIIKAATHSLVDHCGIITSTDGALVEAMPGGVRRAHIVEYFGRGLYLSAPEGTPQQRNQIAEIAEAQVGTPYNDLAIVDDGLESLGVFWGWLANLANGDHEVICSQLVAMCADKAGLDWMCGKKRASEVTPADLKRRPGMTRLDWRTA